MKGLFRAVGVLITIASLVFVTISIHRSFVQLTEDILSVRFLSAVGVLSIVYASALQLVGFAWHEMIIVVDGNSISRSSALAVFNRSQVYKYLPGNVFHMVGRYGLAKTAGATHRSLAFAQIGEIACIAATALGVAAALSAPTLMAYVNLWYVALVGVMAFIAMAAAILAVMKFRNFDLAKWSVVMAIRVFPAYLLFFIVNGLMVHSLLFSVQSAGSLGLVIGISSAAWLLGFIIPGAPGGLGAREAVMIGGLTGMGIPVSTATVVAIGHRAASIAGDAIVASLEFIARSKSRIQ